MNRRERWSWIFSNVSFIKPRRSRKDSIISSYEHRVKANYLRIYVGHIKQLNRSKWNFSTRVYFQRETKPSDVYNAHVIVLVYFCLTSAQRFTADSWRFFTRKLKNSCLTKLDKLLFKHWGGGRNLDKYQTKCFECSCLVSCLEIKTLNLAENSVEEPKLFELQKPHVD